LRKSPPKKAEPGERAWLAAFKAGLAPAPASSGLLLGPGDDGALWQPRPGFHTVLTADLLAEGVHFDLKRTSPWELGAKAAAVNLSDLAAMGAQPRAFLVSVALPRRRNLGAAWLDAFHQGLHAWASAFGAAPAGGDISASKSGLFIDATFIGEVEKGRALRRNGAKPGDWLLCTGSLGDSAAGLALASKAARGLHAGSKRQLLKRHKTPLPRVLAGRWLVKRKAATACIDVSDGLASEALHLSQESGVAVEIFADAIPYSPALLSAAAALRHDPLDWALNGGEDYELLFTAPPKLARELLEDMPDQAGCTISVVGEVKRGRGAWLIEGNKRRALKGGYEHRLG
jgi:thiamine-monophosphate kinase